MKLGTFLRELGQPVAYYPKLAQITGGVVANLFLCQMYYWQGKQDDPNGWIYKTQAEIEAETGLSRTEQETARRLLRQRGLLKERYKGLPRRLEFWLSEDELENCWAFFLEYKSEKPQVKTQEHSQKELGASTAKKPQRQTTHLDCKPLQPLPDKGYSIMQDSCIIECRNPAGNNAGILQSSLQESSIIDCRVPALLNVEIPQAITLESCNQVCGITSGNIYSENTPQITKRDYSHSLPPTPRYLEAGNGKEREGN